MANKARRTPLSGTSSSAFGAPGRVNHDSSRFYTSRMYEDLPKEESLTYIHNPLPESVIDHLICGTSEDMRALSDNSVHLMVTSPPYNAGKQYDNDLTLSEYLQFLGRVWKEVYRVLVPGGRACINVANLGRRPYLPIHAPIASQMIELGYHMRGELIWHKGSSAGTSTAWGSWMSPSNPTLRDTHEYILVFSKGSFKRQEPTGKEPTISKEQFLEYTKSVWSFPAESATKIGHPAPFPIELPFRLIQLYTYAADVILDPFMGSGQTAIAALKASRHFVGYEIDPAYVALANKRVLQFQSTELAPRLFDMPSPESAENPRQGFLDMNRSGT